MSPYAALKLPFSSLTSEPKTAVLVMSRAPYLWSFFRSRAEIVTFATFNENVKLAASPTQTVVMSVIRNIYFTDNKY
jgi:hypothetical protein